MREGNGAIARARSARVWLSVLVAGAYVILASCGGSGVPTGPRDQQAFEEAVTSLRPQFRRANDMQRTRLEDQAGVALCRALGVQLADVETASLAVSNWVGRVDWIDMTTGGNEGILTLRIGDDIRVTNVGAAFTRESPLFDFVASLETGQVVSFSGRFSPDRRHCLNSSAWRSEGRVNDPEFFFTYTAIGPVGRALVTTQAAGEPRPDQDAVPENPWPDDQQPCGEAWQARASLACQRRLGFTPRAESEVYSIAGQVLATCSGTALAENADRLGGLVAARMRQGRPLTQSRLITGCHEGTSSGRTDAAVAADRPVVGSDAVLQSATDAAAAAASASGETRAESGYDDTTPAYTSNDTSASLTTASSPEMPREYRGRWRTSLEQCGQQNISITGLDITASRIAYADSSYGVVGATSNGSTLQVQTSNAPLEMSLRGEVLTTGDGTRRQRCGSVAASSSTTTTTMPPRRSERFVISNPDWVSRPSPDDMARFYPPRAVEDEVTGDTRIRCTVTTYGTLTECEVVSETPADQGFGEAALRASRQFRMRPRAADGQPVEGGVVTVPIRWRLG